MKHRPTLFFRAAKSLLFTLLLALPAAFAAADHPFHVSTCDLEYSEKNKALQVTLHLFIDDLERALQQNGAPVLRLGTPKEHPQAKDYVRDYLKSKLVVEADGKKMAFRFVGSELSDDMAALWCYLEATGLPRPGTVRVSNYLLLDAFDDQKNIVHLKWPEGKKAYFLLGKGRETDTAAF